MVTQLSPLLVLVSFYPMILAYSQLEITEALESCKGQTLCYITFPPPPPTPLPQPPVVSEEKQEEIPTNSSFDFAQQPATFPPSMNQSKDIPDQQYMIFASMITYLSGAVLGGVILRIVTIYYGKNNKKNSSITIIDSEDTASPLIETSSSGSNYTYTFLKLDDGEEQCFIHTG